MRRAALLAAGASLAVALAAAAAAPQATYVKIPGTRVSLKRPFGMNLARNYSGLTTPDGAITVVVTELERPLSDARKNYSPEMVPAMGMKMLGYSEVEIAGHPGFIAYLRETQPKAVWLAAFGDEEESVVLRGGAPLAQAKQVTETIHEILVSARWNRERSVDPFQGFDFELAGKTPLRFALRVGPQLFFTRNGDPRRDPKEPELAISRSSAFVAAERRDEFCKDTLVATPGVGLTSDAKQADVEVDGLKGCEMMVAGRELATKQDLLVYQLILFHPGGHYLFRGRVGWEQQFRFVDLLIETVRAFKRKG